MRRRSPLLALVLVSTVVATAACEDVLGPGYTSFTVAVDSVTGPDTVRAGSSYVQRLWGPLGNTSCSTVDRVFVRPGALATEIQVQGRNSTGTCLQQPSYMSESVTLTAPATPGPYAIRVLRPGPVLVKSIVVR